MKDNKITMAHGSGGDKTRELIEQVFLPAYGNPSLKMLTDSAFLKTDTQSLAFTTDSFVIDPIFFPGGDIGALSVVGTCNDLAVSGAIPSWLSVSFIIEESFPIESLKKIVQSIANWSANACVQVVTGDTKVVERGKADKIFINTAGVGVHEGGDENVLSPNRIALGDAIIVTNDIGRHGIAVLGEREGMRFETDFLSDMALLSPLFSGLRSENISVKAARDLTRGGLGAALVELAQQTGFCFDVTEQDVPVIDSVKAACEMLGFDPFFVANEGCCILFVEPQFVESTLRCLRGFSQGRWASEIGTVTDQGEGKVLVKNDYGVQRPLHWHTVDQLPRIC